MKISVIMQHMKIVDKGIEGCIFVIKIYKTKTGGKCNKNTIGS